VPAPQESRPRRSRSLFPAKKGRSRSTWPRASSPWESSGRRSGAPLEEGQALDKDGNPTTDAGEAAILLPLGGAKGSGLALLIECMTSLVTANPLLAEALERTALGARHRQNGAVIALDLARFVDPAEFKRQAGRLARAIKALPPQPGMEILLPGERGARAAAQRRRDGIPVPDPVLEELRHLMEEPA
jgi:ureidoglycolate dehydrogenase (NAD+)